MRTKTEAISFDHGKLSSHVLTSPKYLRSHKIEYFTTGYPRQKYQRELTISLNSKRMEKFRGLARCASYWHEKSNWVKEFFLTPVWQW